jgi:hypothetical protein
MTSPALFRSVSPFLFDESDVMRNVSSDPLQQTVQRQGPIPGHGDRCCEAEVADLPWFRLVSLDPWDLFKREEAEA